MMKEAFMGIEETCNAVCDFVNLQDAYIRSCVGCETCMTNHLKGNWDFRCVHKSGSDHFYFIEQLMREADAIIVSSPAYNLLPTGILIRFLNKLHASGNYRDVVHHNNKIGAAFSLGGTDWTNFTLSGCKMLAMELCGSYEAIVDAAHFDFHPSSGSVLLDDALLARMHELGVHVGEALLAKEAGKSYGYQGDPGICPDCHGTMLEKKADGWYCPQCQTKATLSMDNGELNVDFTAQERAKNRWSPAGQELHDNNIRKGHQKAFEGKDIIAQKRKKYVEYKKAIQLPELETE